MSVASTCTSTRQAPKQNGIIDKLRSAIVQGKLKPGDRLPVRTELEIQHNASRVTVQKALDELIRDGFVVSKGKLGTFIADTPPCLNHYGLILPFSPTHPRWTGYYDALMLSLHELNESLQDQIHVYQGINRVTDENFPSLCDDVYARRLAGLLFAEGPIELTHTPLIREQVIPMVASMSGNHHPGLEHMVSCGFDLSSGLDLACKILRQHDVQRMAVIMISTAREPFSKFMEPIMNANGFAYNPVFCQSAPMEHREEAACIAQLLMSLPKEQRPDGLYISDDNLVPAVCRGLIKTGVKVGVELHLVAHRNYPSQANHILPMHDVIFDIRQMLSICLKRLEAKRMGDDSMKPVKIKAIRDSEIKEIKQKVDSLGF